MYDFNFIINGKTFISVVDNNFKNAEVRVRKLFGYEITKIDIQDIIERN